MNYEPLNEEQFLKLETELKSIRAFLPEGQMRYMWEMCNTIRGKNENQPCACRSSAGLWTRCIDDLRKFVDEKRNQ